MRLLKPLPETYPNEVLEAFDFVVASVHGRFKMDRASQTERIIRGCPIPTRRSSGI